MCCRYREELLHGRSVHDAVTEMLMTSGHIILVSGSTLTLCFLGLCFFPVASLSSPGYGTAIALFVTIACNLTATPCMLLQFNHFFKNSVRPVSCLQKRYAASESEPLIKTTDSVVSVRNY